MKKSFALLMLVSMMAMAGCGRTSSGTSSGGTSTEPGPVSPSTPSTSTGGDTTGTSTPVEKTALAAPVVTVDPSVSHKVRWDDVTNADYYQVYVNGDTVGVRTAATSYEVPLTDSGVTSSVQVKAVNDAGDYLDSPLSTAISVTHTENPNTSWTTSSSFVEQWSADKGVLGTVPEGLDLKAGQSMAIVKTITADTSVFNVTVRDFEGQESSGGAKVQLKVNGNVVNPANFEGSSVQLDPNCGRGMMITYDLSSYVDATADIIRIVEVSNTSTHCVILGGTLENATWLSNHKAATSINAYWGRNYSNYGELNATDDLVNSIQNLADDTSWIRVGEVDNIGEGLKLQRESSISKYITITENNSMMTLGVRNFGGVSENYGGGVSVNGTFLEAVGNEVPYFTKISEPTYFAEATDGGQVATMKTYDLSAYIGDMVYLTIANLKCYATAGDNGDLVIGSLSFAKPIKLENNTNKVGFDVSTAKTVYPNLPFMVSGHYTVFDEGVSFRSNDFASGIAQRFDLTEIPTGKNVYVKTYWRAKNNDPIAKFKTLINGDLVNTYDYLLRNTAEEEDLACVAFDLSAYVGETVDIGVFIQSRDHRDILTKLEYYMSDTPETNISYPGTPIPVLADSHSDYAWGRDFAESWSGEMGGGPLPRYQTLLEAGWQASGQTGVFNEGYRLGYEGSISKEITVDELHTTMALSARTFGRDFKGEVTVTETSDPVAIRAIGYETDYFTKDAAVTKSASVPDDCQNAVMYVYDLSSYATKTITITINNLMGVRVDDHLDADGFTDELIIGSIGFTGIKKVTENYVWDAGALKDGGNTQAIEILPAGPAAIYNEGVNLRTNDFSGGFTKTFDLSDSALTGKTVVIKLGFRNFESNGEDITFKELLNGQLIKTETVNINENTKQLEFDVTQLIGMENINLGIFVASRTNRIVLTGYEIVVEDAVAPK